MSRFRNKVHQNILFGVVLLFSCFLLPTKAELRRVDAHPPSNDAPFYRRRLSSRKTFNSSSTALAATTNNAPSFPTKRRQQLSNKYGNDSFTSLQINDVELISTRSKNRKMKKASKKAPKEEYEPNLVPYDEEEVPSLEEIRASLGPIGKTIANSVEVGIVAGGSYISGGILGYGIGGVMGIPKFLLKSSLSPDETPIQRKIGEEMKRRISAWNGNAVQQAGSWAKLSASFSGFHALSRVMRGGKEDKWNGIWGSAATGAFMSRKGGSQAMLQASASYAGITYLLDMFVGGGGRGKTMQNGQYVDNEFGFRDAPVEEY